MEYYSNDFANTVANLESVEKLYTSELNSLTNAAVISIPFAIASVIFDKLLIWILLGFSKFERHRFKIHEMESIMYKITLSEIRKFAALASFQFIGAGK